MFRRLWVAVHQTQTKSRNCSWPEEPLSNNGFAQYTVFEWFFHFKDTRRSPRSLQSVLSPQVVMFIPTAQKNVTAREVDDSPLPYFGTGGSWSGLILVFFLLTFYALALWDRWLQLKMVESRRLQAQQSFHNYGATDEITRSHSPSLRLSRSPSHSSTDSFPRAGNSSPLHLAPPTVAQKSSRDVYPPMSYSPR